MIHKTLKSIIKWIMVSYAMMTTLIMTPTNLKGGCEHFTMCIFHFQLIDLDLWNVFCEVSPWGNFLFSLQRQNKVCNPGERLWCKYIKKLFIGIPINFTFIAISPKLQGVWRRNFRFAIRKIWAFIWNQKIHYFRLSPGDENVIGIRAFNWYIYTHFLFLL